MKDNIEDFFKHTLEDFTDAPTDKVWEGVSKRLQPPNKYRLNSNLLFPFFTCCLFAISVFSLFSNINLHQKTEKLAAKIVEDQTKIKYLIKNYNVSNQKYLALDEYVTTVCNPLPSMGNIQFSDELPLRDEDIIPLMEL